MKEVFGVGCVLIDPLQRRYLISSSLKFECMNNAAEYEALILGLQRAIDLNVAIQKLVGELELLCDRYMEIYTRYPLISRFINNRHGI